jgi:hypothetical protein
MVLLARQFLHFSENLGTAARIAAFSLPKFHLALSVIVLFSGASLDSRHV